MNEPPQAKVDANDAGQCVPFHAEAPVEDPNVSCWLDLNRSSDQKLDYICLQDHPCLDFDDRKDHSDDSY